MREMKDSGIEWIGEIPADWELSKIGAVYEERNEKVSDVDFQPLSITKQGVVPQLETAAKTNDGENRKLIRKNDFVINSRSDRRGSCGISEYDGSCSLINTVLKPRRNMCNAYYSFVFRSERFADEFYRWGNGIVDDLWSTKWSNMKRIYIPAPSLQEQRCIADYLDRKCSQIDAIIARQQEVIEKLKAYKLSVITEAVTKGLNPDVPMKDSGVEWIGEIPEHWKMVRLKFLLSHIIDCPHETPIYSADGDYLVIRTAGQDLGKLRTDEDMYRLDEGEYQNRIRRMPLEKDDIVYGREGERWGLACLVPESNRYCLGQRMLQFRCKRELFLPRFAMWALNSKFVYLQGAVDTIGSTSPHVNISTVRNFLIPVLPISEQQEIAEYIDKKMSQLDKEIEHRENLICKLNEYKKSLIYEVVTGKQEV